MRTGQGVGAAISKKLGVGIQPERLGQTLNKRRRWLQRGCWQLLVCCTIKHQLLIMLDAKELCLWYWQRSGH